MRRAVVFVKYYEKGSTSFSGDQIAAALEAQGVAARSVAADELRGIRDAIAVFIKTSRLGDLWAARRRGNLTVLDVHDTLCFKRRLKNRWLYDGLIFKNRRQLEDYGDRRRWAEVIYHQADERYGPHRAGEEELRVCYLGEPRSLRLWGRLPGVECVSMPDWFRLAPSFNCHLSVREPRREFLYKPGAKVSTAAICRAVLVTTRDESAVEMLGPDYPYYTASAERQAIEAALQRARSTIGGPEWRAARARLDQVLERTRLGRILDDYVGFFRRLEERRAP